MTIARRTQLHHTAWLAAALAMGALAGCGAEVAGSAAVAGGLAATQARQAQLSKPRW